MILIETERLILRRFNLDDLDEIYRLVYADPAVKVTWSGATGKSDEIKARFAERHILANGDFCLHALVSKEMSTLIGLMGFQRHPPGAGHNIWYLQSEDEPNRSVGFNPDFIEVELTYALGRALVPYGFDTLGIGRIIQGVRRDNPNSINLMRRLGFRIENGLEPSEVVGILDSANRATAG
jgi:RimJ/RimL family protein N-acetyltransferase